VSTNRKKMLKNPPREPETKLGSRGTTLSSCSLMLLAIAGIQSTPGQRLGPIEKSNHPALGTSVALGENHPYAEEQNTGFYDRPAALKTGRFLCRQFEPECFRIKADQPPPG